MFAGCSSTRWKLRDRTIKLRWCDSPPTIVVSGILVRPTSRVALTLAVAAGDDSAELPSESRGVALNVRWLSPSSQFHSGPNKIPHMSSGVMTAFPSTFRSHFYRGITRTRAIPAKCLSWAGITLGDLRRRHSRNARKWNDLPFGKIRFHVTVSLLLDRCVCVCVNTKRGLDRVWGPNNRTNQSRRRERPRGFKHIHRTYVPTIIVL